MSRASIERRLIDVGDRLKRLRNDLRIAEEQLDHFGDAADDARLRAVVSETAIADRDHREAQKHVAAMERHRSELLEEITALESEQDRLLDELMS